MTRKYVSTLKLSRGKYITSEISNQKMSHMQDVLYSFMLPILKKKPKKQQQQKLKQKRKQYNLKCQPFGDIFRRVVAPNLKFSVKEISFYPILKYSYG